MPAKKNNMNKKVNKSSNIDDFNKLHHQILTKIKPNKRIRTQLGLVIVDLKVKIDEVVSGLNLKYAVESILVGSTAKDTYLTDPDIDLFIMFPTSIAVDDLRKIGLEIGHKTLPTGEERYAEHPYISGKFQGFDTDIVPCYKLDDIKDRMTAVDRTPFHTNYVVEHLAPGQQDEVRLLKQFMKGIGTYSAEIKVQGFSGYLCELLILKFESFLGLLEAAIYWTPDLVFMLTDNNTNKDAMINKTVGSNKSKLSKKLALKFKDEPLVFIDPVDNSRNVGSALAKDKFELFIQAAKAYLDAPRKNFFFPGPIKPLTLTQLEKQIDAYPRSIIGLEFTTPEIIPDILYGQLRKCQQAIQKLLNSAGFCVEYSAYHRISNKETVMFFELTNRTLPKIATHLGPPEGHKNVNDFKAKWSTSSTALGKPYLKDRRWHVEISREFTEPLELLKAKILDLNVGKHIMSEIKKNIQFYSDSELVKSGLEEPLTRFISRKYPWENQAD